MNFQSLNDFKQGFQDLRQQIIQHPLYSKLKTIDHLQIFMESHIFAVWDFMSLLKSLQLNLTCFRIPWVPVGNNQTRRFINEIVLSEESDCVSESQYLSHFELYIKAMQDCGANPQKVLDCIEAAKSQQDFLQILSTQNLPQSVKTFLSVTSDLLTEDKVHKIAASFAFAREELIPDMFRQFVQSLQHDTTHNVGTFLYYLERHIELDEKDHSPMAFAMLEQLCENDSKKWDEALQSVRVSLQARKVLWDGILKKIENSGLL